MILVHKLFIVYRVDMNSEQASEDIFKDPGLGTLWQNLLFELSKWKVPDFPGESSE